MRSVGFVGRVRLGIKEQRSCEICGALYITNPKSFKDSYRSRTCSVTCEWKLYRAEHPQFVERQKENHRMYMRNLYLTSPEHVNKLKQNIRARRDEILLIDAMTSQQWDITCEYFGGCIYCGGLIQHKDHFIPRKLGGKYTWNNMVPACEVCNSKKQDMHPKDFCKKIGKPKLYRIVVQYLSSLG